MPERKTSSVNRILQFVRPIKDNFLGLTLSKLYWITLIIGKKKTNPIIIKAGSRKRIISIMFLLLVFINICFSNLFLINDINNDYCLYFLIYINNYNCSLSLKMLFTTYKITSRIRKLFQISFFYYLNALKIFFWRPG